MKKFLTGLKPGVSNMYHLLGSDEDSLEYKEITSWNEQPKAYQILAAIYGTDFKVVDLENECVEDAKEMSQVLDEHYEFVFSDCECYVLTEEPGKYDMEED